MAESKGGKKKEKGKPGEKESSSGSSVSGGDDDDEDQIGRGVGTAAITVDRDEYLQAHRDLTFDLRQLQIKNNILHRRLAEYYKKRKLEHVLKPLEGAMDLEEKYQQKLYSYEELKEKEEREVADIKAKVNAVEMQYSERLENAEKRFDGLQGLERTTGTGLIYSKKGKPIADKTVERFLLLQRRKSEQSSALCLRYIRVRNAVSELEAIVRKLEMLAPGLYVAQYEQLHIDNQNYMTKIEEREDELIKNRAKCTEHNQMLAHIREKMHHTDEVIDFAECDLGDAEIEFLRAREDLGSVKSRRDKLRWSLEGERLKAGLLTRKDLLRDFQDATDEVVSLREKKQQLESDIEKTTRDLREARRRVQLHHAGQNAPNSQHTAPVLQQTYNQESRPSNTHPVSSQTAQRPSNEHSVAQMAQRQSNAQVVASQMTQITDAGRKVSIALAAQIAQGAEAGLRTSNGQNASNDAQKPEVA